MLFEVFTAFDFINQAVQSVYQGHKISIAEKKSKISAGSLLVSILRKPFLMSGL